MNESPASVAAPANPPVLRRRFTWTKRILVTGAVLVGLGAWWYQYNLNASPFRPVQLTAAEQEAVQTKLATLENQVQSTDPAKTLVLNEREINGYLQQQGLGDQIKVSINNGNIGAQFLIPVDKDFPMMGGSTVRVKVAFNTKLDANRQLALSLADISVGGISLPNDWLGNMKGLNLLDHNKMGEGDAQFFKSFAAGIKDFQLKNGELRLVLND
ncbi:hypothetical protein [Verrucomicrobium sp. BvORR106]|uniref:hypothetical protein n=1 Tax=Verrucomicrobium sp. BvORR106 TaxID=1403819 RepID=UPI000571DD4D|nr:hypothetical protein [Verrucomicrobium sp. BvORR106]